MAEVKFIPVYTFTHNDEKVAAWLKTQRNKAFSLKCLIYNAIREYGDIDLQDYFLSRVFDSISGGGGLSDVDLSDVKKASKSKIKPELEKKLTEVKNAKSKPDKKTDVPEVKSEVKPEAKSEPKPEPKPAAEVKPPVNKPVETAPNTNNDPLFDDDGFVDPDTLWQD